MPFVIGIGVQPRLASTDKVFRCVHPVCTRASGCSAQHRAGGRNIFAPPVTQLLMLRCPAAWHSRVRFVRSGPALSGRVKRAVPLLQNKTQNMNTTENLIANGCSAIASQPINQVIKPVKFPAQPQEWKIVSLRECPTPDTMQHCETPDQAAAYWKTHIATHPYFNSECECLVVFILNTRRRIKGHYLVSIGTMDTILCHPREVFRLAIMASASAIIICHHPSGESTPSEADIKITRDLIRASQLLKIEVLDHIVIGNPNHTSLRSLGYFYS
jgi:DNA repair protein RadC